MADIVARDTRVDWAAILAGASIAIALGLILSAFGVGIGLTLTSPYEGEGSSPGLFAFAAGVWMLVIQLLGFGAGGYVAARLRARQPELSEHEVDVRDGLHGLIVWGVGVIAAGIISFAVISGGTAATQSADGRGLVESVSAAANAEIDQAAASERVENPEASDETLAERRAEIARKLAVISAFVTAASLLAGGVAAFFAAGIGGRHRDEAVTVKFFVLRRSRAPVATAPSPGVTVVTPPST